MNQGLGYEIASVMPNAIATGLFVSLASFTAPPVNQQGPTGNITAPWVAVAGLQSIPCMNAPPSMLRVDATEQKSIADILSRNLRHVLLNGYYPVLFNASRSGWRVAIDGVLYDLLGAEADSQLTQTRIELQLAVI